MISSSGWKFEGNFDDYKQPGLLFSFLKWVISGATISCKLKEKDIVIQQTCKYISQIIDSAIKTNRQINYVNKSFVTGPFRNK